MRKVASQETLGTLVSIHTPNKGEVGETVVQVHNLTTGETKDYTGIYAPFVIGHYPVDSAVGALWLKDNAAYVADMFYNGI